MAVFTGSATDNIPEMDHHRDNIMTTVEFNPFREAINRLRTRDSFRFNDIYICIVLNGLRDLHSNPDEWRICQDAVGVVQSMLSPWNTLDGWFLSNRPFLAHVRFDVQDCRKQWLIHLADLLDRGELDLRDPLACTTPFPEFKINRL